MSTSEVFEFSQASLTETHTTSDTDALLVKKLAKLRQLSTELAAACDSFVEGCEQERQYIEKMLTDAMMESEELHTAPRDEEFEYLEEYQERMARQKIDCATQQQVIRDFWNNMQRETLAQICDVEQVMLNSLKQIPQKATSARYSFNCRSLTNWHYQLDQGILNCHGVVNGTVPLERLRLDLSIKMPRDQAKLYRTDPEAFRLYGQLALQADSMSIVALNCYVEVARVGYFSADVVVTLEEGQEELAHETFKQAVLQTNREPDNEHVFEDRFPDVVEVKEAMEKVGGLIGICKQRDLERDAFLQAMQANTERALERFLTEYPRTAQAEEVRKKLDEFTSIRNRRELDAFVKALHTNTQQAFESFLKTYPKSPYAKDVSKKLEDLGTLDADIKSVTEALDKMATNKPKTVAALQNIIKSRIGRDTAASRIDAIVSSLAKNHYIRVNGDKISYK